MPATPLNHLCVLVANLEAAVEQFKVLFGLTFHPPSRMRFNRIFDSSERALEVRATLSIEGPPHIEFIEAVADGIFGVAQGLGLHHVGVLDSCIEEHARQFSEEMNVHSRAHILTRTGKLYAWFSEPDTTHGVRFEFINEPARAALLSKLAPNSGSSSSAGENFFQI